MHTAVLSRPVARRKISFLAQYERDGFCLQPNLFDADICEALIAAAKAFKDFDPGSAKPVMMPHRENPLFLQAMKHPALVTTMEELVGGRVSGLQTEFFYCKPGTRGFSSHQDNFFVEAPEGVFASAWIALTDTSPDKGGLIVYPGTHKEGLLPVRKTSLHKDNGQDPNANNEEVVIPRQYHAFHATVPQGAALYLHGHLVHASNRNITNQWRYVLLCTYIRQGSPFRAGRYAERTEINVYS